MNGYYRDKVKSAILTAVCCLVAAAALFGLIRMIGVISWNARNKDYRQSITASLEYAHSHNCLRITVDESAPVKIHYDHVNDFNRYLVLNPAYLPAARAKAGTHMAAFDCGDGSLLEVCDAGERRLCLFYCSAAGKSYRYTLEYATAYDGWEYLLQIIAGENRPG